MDQILSELGLSEKTLNKVYEHKDFIEVLKSIEESNPRFKQLPLNQRRLALALFLKGDINSIDNLWSVFYIRPIPTMEEFLHKDYIGSDASFYQEGVWRRDLLEIFSPTSTYWEWICTGCIGGGKTTVSRVGHFYNLFKLTSMKYPQLSLGSGETKPLALILLTVSKYKAKEVFDGFKILLKQSKYFHRVKKEENLGDYKQEEGRISVPYWEHKVEGFPRFTFPNNIYVGTGSRESHTIGSDLFGASLDEAEFRASSKESKEAFKLYSELCVRVNSRFGDSQHKLVTLVSSVKSDTGVIPEHIKAVDPELGMTYVSSYPIWEIKPMYKGVFEEYGYFYVLRGTKTHPSRILDDSDYEMHEKGKFYVPENCKVVKVPSHPVLIKDFKLNVEKALKDHAGEAVSGGERPFDDLSGIEDKLLCSELYLTAPLPIPGQEYKSLFSQLPGNLWTKTPDGLRLKRYPNAKRYCHLDLADTGEAGITVIHKELLTSGEVAYVTDFTCKITSPNKISYTALEDFLVDLKLIGNIYFKLISADQYQSVFMLQKLTQHKVADEVKKVAMGTKTEPFNAVGTLISEGAIKVGYCPELKDQLKGIFFYEGNVQYETERKDIADSWVGAIYDAINNPSDVPTHVYEMYQDLQNNLDIFSLEDVKEL